MLAIKLQKIGKKKQPSYRVVIQEKRTKLNSLCVEDLGWYNPRMKKAEIKKDRVAYWLKIGAQPTDTVHNLLVKNKIINAPKRAVHKVSKKVVEAKTPETVA